MWILSLSQEDPLEEGMATHPSILAWKIPRIEESAGYSPQGCTESDRTETIQKSHIHHILYTHSSIDGCFYSFYRLSIVCCNVHCLTSICLNSFNPFGYIPKSRITGSYDNSVQLFKKLPSTLSHLPVIHRSSISPHPVQHLFLFICFFLQN